MKVAILKSYKEKYLIVKRFILIFSGSLLCTYINLNAQKIDEYKLKSYCETLLLKEDSTIKLLNFSFVKLDTTTLKNQYVNLYMSMGKNLEYNFRYYDSLRIMIKSDKEMAKTMDYLSKELSQPYKDDVKNNTMESKKVLLFDSLLVIDMRKIEKLINKADSVRPVLYLAKCHYTIKKQDETEISDFFPIRLDLNYNIITTQQYSTILNNLYKAKSGYIYP
ncbi:hypothetical protein [Parasediminibacterium sp. JCM 36343]|uniref:hypothetical protein n=1 Tax=Parasediminibacterium sp. JCM 36343 TaxID=3374279 RepID=UPI00397DECBB